MKDNDMAPDEQLQPVLAQIQTDGEGALARLGELILGFSGDPRLHFLRGSVLAGLERYAEGRDAMQKAIDIAPGYGLARFQLGLLELSSGDGAAAQATWFPLLNLPADNPLYLFAKGLNTMLLGELEAAISLLEEGIRLNTELPPMNRDMTLMIDGMREKLAGQTVVEDLESDAHFLLKQYSFKDPKH